MVPVTLIEAGPCVVLQVKSIQKEGYTACQLGFDGKKEASTNKPDMGRFRKIKTAPLRFTREIRVNGEDAKNMKPADNITLDIFSVGDYIDVSATSIGKGFQGGVKRWHWKGGPKTHGSMSHRAPGSIGASSDPSRVYKGQHLPGHMGNQKVTAQNLEVVAVDKENNLMMVKGSVPGPKGNYLIINKSFRKKKKEPKPQAVEEEKKKVNPLKKSKKSMKK
jgi:large subunit ribosomal protein L3